MTSCLICMDLAALIMLNEQQINFYGHFKTNITLYHP